MKATWIGAALGVVLMTAPTYAQSSYDQPRNQKTSNVQIEVKSSRAEYGWLAATNTGVRTEPTTTGSGGGSGDVTGSIGRAPAARIDCQVITVRSPQPGEGTIIRKFSQCD